MTLNLKNDEKLISEYNINSLEIADVDPINKGSYLIDTLSVDKNNSKQNLDQKPRILPP